MSVTKIRVIIKVVTIPWMIKDKYRVSNRNTEMSTYIFILHFIVYCMVGKRRKWSQNCICHLSMIFIFQGNIFRHVWILCQNFDMEWKTPLNFQPYVYLQMYQTLNDTPSRNFLFIRYNLVNTFRSFNYIVSNMLSFLSSSTHRKPISDKKILFISHPSALKC